MSEAQTVDEFIEKQIQSGKYETRDALVHDAVRLLQARELAYDDLSEMLRPGIERFKNSEPGIPADADDIIERGMNRLASDKNGNTP